MCSKCYLENFQFAVMSNIIIVLLAISIALATQECNATMSDLITGKIINQIEDWRYKSLGFMFNVATSEYFCGVALISTSVAISDGSCIPNGTSLSKIQIHFRVYEQNIDRPNYGIRKRMKIPNDNVNIIFIVLNREVNTQLGHVKWQDLCYCMRLPRPRDILVQVGWNQDWQVRQDIYTIQSMDRYKIHINSDANYRCPLTQQRGHLLFINKRLIGISILSQHPTEHISYVKVLAVDYSIMNIIQDLTPYRPHKRKTF